MNQKQKATRVSAVTMFTRCLPLEGENHISNKYKNKPENIRVELTQESPEPKHQHQYQTNTNTKPAPVPNQHQQQSSPSTKSTPKQHQHHYQDHHQHQTSTRFVRFTEAGKPGKAEHVCLYCGW